MGDNPPPQPHREDKPDDQTTPLSPEVQATIDGIHSALVALTKQGYAQINVLLQHEATHIDTEVRAKVNQWVSNLESFAKAHGIQL